MENNSLEKELGYWLNGKAVDEASLLKRLEQADQDSKEGRILKHGAFQGIEKKWD